MKNKFFEKPFIRFSPNEEPEVFGDSKWAHLVKFSHHSVQAKEDLLFDNHVKNPTIKQYSLVDDKKNKVFRTETLLSTENKSIPDRDECEDD